MTWAGPGGVARVFSFAAEHVMPGLFIEDGYTVTAALKADPDGVYEAVRFEYRPVLPARHMWVQDATVSTEERDRRMAVVLAEQLVSWDVTTRKGAPVPLTADNMRRIAYLPRLMIYNIVAGLSASDATGETVNTTAAGGN